MIGLVTTAITLFLTACAGGITQQNRSLVTYHDTFAQLQKQAGGLIGEVVLFGGKIIAINNHQGGTELAVLQLPLNSRYRPMDNDRSEGRFLIATDQFLDPAIYARGNPITVVGELVAVEERHIGDMPYLYPKLVARELKLWRPHEGMEPRFRFGVGIGASF